MESGTEVHFRGIIPFSGGIDSAAALYLTLKNNPRDTYLVFRSHLINGTSGSRTIREGQAAEEILEKMKSMGINNFRFRRLSFDYSSLGKPPVWDNEVINYIAGVIIQAHPEISEFIEGAMKNDWDLTGFQDILDRIAIILFAASGKTSSALKIVFPLKEMTKYEVMKSLPPELLRLTWSCRHPRIGPPYTYVRCHECPQCLLIDKVLADHPGEFERVIT